MLNEVRRVVGWRPRFFLTINFIHLSHDDLINLFLQNLQISSNISDLQPKIVRLDRPNSHVDHMIFSNKN